MSAHSEQYCGWCDGCTERIAELEATCAAMKRAGVELLWMAGNWAQAGGRYDQEVYEKAKQDFESSDAGKAMLERLEKAEKESRIWRECAAELEKKYQAIRAKAREGGGHG